MKKVFVSVVLALAAGLLLGSGCAKERPAGDLSLQKVLEKKTLVLGLDDAFPPMGFRNENNEIVGFDIDVAREVCKRLGIELVPQPIDWNAKEQELNTGKIDCIWNGFTITPARQEQLNFTEPYVANAQVLVVRADVPISKLSELAGKQVGLQAGSSAADALEGAAEFKATLAKVVEFKDNLTALMDLEARGVDAVAMDLLVANDNIGRSGKAYRILEERLAPEEYGVGFRKGDQALRDAVQAQLSAMAKDGALAEIAVRWFGADITTVKEGVRSGRNRGRGQDAAANAGGDGCFPPDFRADAVAGVAAGAGGGVWADVAPPVAERGGERVHAGDAGHAADPATDLPIFCALLLVRRFVRSVHGGGGGVCDQLRGVFRGNLSGGDRGDSGGPA